MLSRLKRLEKTLHPYCSLLWLLCLLLILRLPNFFEPYWYGDEGIYLTIGNALRGGERLYAEIIDHKTPLIYYMAMMPSQLTFRLFLLAWMLVTTTAFYFLAQKLTSLKLALLATLAFIILTTFPWLEGNIPNGELFVMGFILVAAMLISRTWFFTRFLADESPKIEFPFSDIRLLLISGILAGLGILTKVPALFDATALVSVAWFSVTRSISWKPLGLAIKPAVGFGILFAIGLIIPIVISIVYFVARGSGQAYLDYGLLYNFRYAGSWSLPFTHPVLIWAFSLLGKASLMGLGILVLTIAKKWLRPAFQFTAAWTLLALFASLLSNRPYPHYFLQLIPPLVLVVAVALSHFSSKKQLTQRLSQGLEIVLAGGLVALTYLVLQLLQVHYYPTVSYYQRWVQLVSGQLSNADYQQTFNGIMADNYRAASIIKPSPNPYLFIWGTNPMLYALSQKIPSGRFTVAFHIKDFQAYDETLASVIRTEPTFIVVMNEDVDTFPEFSQYLTAHYYIPNESFSHFTLWKRQ